MKENEKPTNKDNHLVAGIFLILAVLLLVSYIMPSEDKVTINANGGTVIKQVEIKDDKIVSLPVIEKKGYKVEKGTCVKNEIINCTKTTE